MLCTTSTAPAPVTWGRDRRRLGVTKQAVQKRFTGERTEPVGWERYTERARRLVQEHAPAAAASLGHGWIGTEHLLLGFYAEPEALAPRILLGFGLDRDRVLAGIGARIDNAFSGRGPLTPRAWAALASATREAVMLGHNYVGTEHQLLALLSGVGGVAAEILGEATSRTIAPGPRSSSFSSATSQAAVTPSPSPHYVTRVSGRAKIRRCPEP